jgi:hypothetical protein
MEQSEMTDEFVVGRVKLRKEYAGFHYGGMINNETEHPGLGFTFMYRGGEKGEATIFTYGSGAPAVPDGPMSPVVMEEFRRATDDVVAVEGRAVELVDRYGTGTPDRGREFLCAEFVVTDKNGARRSFLYLTGAFGQFFKIRVSLKTNDPADATARNFADAVAAGLWPTRAHH